MFSVFHVDFNLFYIYIYFNMLLLPPEHTKIRLKSGICIIAELFRFLNI